MQWKNGHLWLNYSEDTKSMSCSYCIDYNNWKSHVIYPVPLELNTTLCHVLVSDKHFLINNVYYQFWLLVHLSFIWCLDFTLDALLWKNGYPMDDLLVQKLISNAVVTAVIGKTVFYHSSEMFSTQVFKANQHANLCANTDVAVNT